VVEGVVAKGHKVEERDVGVVIRTIEANKTEATIVMAAEIADRRLGYDFSTYVLTNKVCRRDD
jgi:hypothetical protein